MFLKIEIGEQRGNNWCPLIDYQSVKSAPNRHGLTLLCIHWNQNVQMQKKRCFHNSDPKIKLKTTWLWVQNLVCWEIIWKGESNVCIKTLVKLWAKLCYWENSAVTVQNMFLSPDLTCHDMRSWDYTPKSQQLRNTSETWQKFGYDRIDSTDVIHLEDAFISK